MKALVQRVNYANLKVDGKLISKIDKGLIVYFGVKTGDSEELLDFFANKIANLRVFEDEEGKMNLSVKDIKGEVLVVSQFTLYGDVKKGFRPSFTEAEKPDIAKGLYEKLIERIKIAGLKVEEGVFGADMKISYENDGPVSIIIEK